MGRVAMIRCPGCGGDMGMIESDDYEEDFGNETGDELCEECAPDFDAVEEDEAPIVPLREGEVIL